MYWHRFSYRTVLICTVGFVVCVGCFVSAGETDYDRGLQLIKAGQLAEAVSAFQKALQADPTNAALLAEYNTLKYVIKLRKDLSQEKNGTQWSIIAERIRRYYLKYHVDSENVAHSLEIYHRFKTTPNAIGVVDAFLKLEQYQEALDFVNSQKQQLDQAIPFQIEKARIFYTADHQDQARQIIREIPIDKLNTPDMLLRLARIQAQTHQYASSVKSLKRCFELTPPNVLPLIKKETETYPEFQPILASSEFTAVMATRSTLSSGDMECAKKWIGMTLDERPKYFKNMTKDNINFDDWQLY